mgnify:CR=1 FL=1
MDSLTRYAMAQREIALAIGEPPATKGYPPSCFAKLPQLVERSGNGLAGQGSITAIYTVLSEGDDQQDPIADAARAILDGHIVLTRRLAQQGHYPAIDVLHSVSRLFGDLAGRTDLESRHTVPYLTSVDKDAAPQLTYAETLRRMIADLTEAARPLPGPEHLRAGDDRVGFDAVVGSDRHRF